MMTSCMAWSITCGVQCRKIACGVQHNYIIIIANLLVACNVAKLMYNNYAWCVCGQSAVLYIQY